MKSPASFLYGLVLTASLYTANAFAGLVANPASVEDVKQVLKLYQIDKATYEGWRRQLEIQNRNSTDPGSTYSYDALKDVVTVDAMAEKMAAELSKYWSADYARLFLKEANSAAAKSSLKLELLQNSAGLQAAKEAFSKLPNKERLAINDYRRSLSYSSFVNASEQMRNNPGNFISTWINNVVQQRVAHNRRMFADFLELSLKAEEDNYTSLLPQLKRPIPVGVKQLDAEFELSYQMQRRRMEFTEKFYRLIPANYLDQILSSESLANPAKIEANLITLSEYETYHEEFYRETENLLDSYFQQVSAIPLTKTNRQERLQNEQNGVVKSINTILQQAELTRSLHQQSRRILELCLKNKGKISLRDKTLMFDDMAVLTEYRTLFAELREISKQLEIQNEEYLRRNRERIKSLRS